MDSNLNPNTSYRYKIAAYIDVDGTKYESDSTSEISITTKKNTGNNGNGSTGDNGNGSTGDNGNGNTGDEQGSNPENIQQNISVNGYIYKVTGDSTVSVVGVTNKKKTTVSVKSTLKFGGKTYKITAIEANAFKNSKKLKKVTIGKNVTTIGTNAFYGCKYLNKVTIGKNVKSIGNKAFYKCTKLSKITIPSKVTKIGKQAFYGCKKLKSITIKTTKLKSSKVGTKAFSGIPKNVKVKVPKSKLNSYKKILKSKGLAKSGKITK